MVHSVGTCILTNMPAQLEGLAAATPGPDIFGHLRGLATLSD